MKNKSSRHKQSNAFKFQTFSERISNVEIHVFHKIGHENESQIEENECRFYETLQKWNVLNLSEGFSHFKKDVNAQCLITLPQLIHNKENVVEVLLQYLNMKNTIFLQPLLELTAALVEDLRNEFYPYFHRFVNILIDLLHLKDADGIEWTFTCLAYMFKFLWKFLSKDITIVLNSVLPLLSDDRPGYIINFACESFSFVARKVKDLQSFLELILETVLSREDTITGCSKLLFEIVHGTTGHFHSCAETWLPFMFRSLANEKYSQMVLFEIIQYVVANMLQRILPEKADLFWNTSYSVLNEFYSDLSFDSQLIHLACGNILKIICQAIEFKNGIFLKNPQKLINQLVMFFKIPNLNESILQIIVQLCSAVFLANKIDLSQEQSSLIISNVQSLNLRSAYLCFVDSLIDYAGFDLFIFPNFVKFFVNGTELETNSLNTLTKIILKKSPFCKTGILLNVWKRYPITFFCEEDRSLVLNNMLYKLNNMENEANYLSAVICLPHINLKSNEIEKTLGGNSELLLKLLNSEQKEMTLESKKRYLFLLMGTVQCMVHLNVHYLLNCEKVLAVLLPLCSDIIMVESLQIVSLYLSKLKDDKIHLSLEILVKINKYLEENFISPFHEVRLLTTYIYSLFEDLPYFIEVSTDFKKDWKLFSICYQIESTDFQVHTFNDQMQCIEKLSFQSAQIQMCKLTPFKLIPLKYLCGLLYVNFQLLWNPLSKIISTYAINGMEINEFWMIFGTQLKTVSPDLHSLPLVKIKFLDDYVNNTFLNMELKEEKIDYCNYRILLWKTLAAFPEIAEAKTRDTSELLLSFLKNEYNNMATNFSKTWDIKSHNIEKECDSKYNLIERSDQDMAKKHIQNIKSKERTISAMLNVFAKIRSPKSMFRESELNQLYLDLLSSKNSEIQKLALDCLMTYRHEYITAYKEQLYNLVDDKNFKNEVSLFRISDDCSVIQEKHRQSLIPIILKIVFSKMTSKSGLRTGGKGFGQMRRNLVLRFLSGCHENEIDMFIQMSFRFYSKYFHGDQFSSIVSISNECNLEKFVPLKRLQSSVNLLLLILEELGGSLSDNLLQYLLKILMVIGALVKGVFSQISLVHAGYRETLKKLRSSSLGALEKIFDHFDKYPWSTEEIDTIFEIFVWPYLKQLEIEGIHSPTALLRLFLQWGSRSRYFELLIKCHADNKELTAMVFIMRLLLNKSTKSSVIKVIMEMINYLLTFKDSQNEQQALPIMVNSILSLENNLPYRNLEKQSLNLGSYIVLPHVPSILNIIKNKLQRSRKGLNTTELSVLSNISEFVWDSESSKTVLDLMIPLFSKMFNLSDDNLLKFIMTIDNLTQKIEQPQKYLIRLLPFFSEISYKPARKQLCKIFNKVAAKSSSTVLNTLARTINEINAWDDRWIDQPNFERRIEAFQEINLLIESKNVEMELGLAIFYNCCYMLKYESDISLKDKSNHYWKIISIELLRNFHDKRFYLLDEHLFVIICEGIKSKNQEFRNECIQLLGYIARHCPNSHIVLEQLNKLTNEADLEVDFFENLTHLQIHRHVRALLKFVDVFTNNVDTQCNRTLIQFVFPLVSWYLCNEKYVSKNSLIDASIEALKVICKLLPWNHYANLLKIYMGKLRYKTIFKKQLVRVIVAILDAFNFDLSSSFVKGVDETSFYQEFEEKKTVQISALNKEGGETVTEEEKSLEDDQQMKVISDEMEMDESMHIDVSNEALLTTATATKVIHTIQKVFLPQLFRLLAEYSHYDSSHKLNKKKTLNDKEEEDLQKIPISLALVKLLQKLPKVILDKNLPMIFMKLATFLKSHLASVRRIARETFEQIICTVGPKYLNIFLDAIQPLLLRGFQVHVLVYTVHGVLASLKDMYEPGDIDKIIATVLNICKADLFGTVAEEKEVEKIRVKIPEAKTTRSYETLQILASFVTEKYLMDLIIPLRSVLLNLRSFKNNKKMQECFRYISLGLVSNKFITHESLMTISYGIISQNVPELFSTEVNNKKNGEKSKQKTFLTERSDCFIIPSVIINKYEAKETLAKVSDNMNNYILVTFGLNIFFNLIKMEFRNDTCYKSFMDPFVKLFRDCLSSQHVKLNILALKCLIGITKYDLPSFKENMKDISKEIFKILHKYAVAGLNKGDNFDLVLIAFKFMSVVLREVKDYTIDKEQLKMLIFYVEQDLHENDRLINALMLLKAITSRKFDLPEIYTVMNKVAKISITSANLQVRNYACQVFLNFFINYPLGKKMNSYIGFYLSQINYEYQSGRQSALWMIQSFINSFPMNILKAQCGSIMVSLGTQLINDDVPECRKIITNCLTNMFKRLTKPERDPLFDIVKLWLKDEKINHRRLAAQLCGIFVDVEKSTFESRIPALMPILLSQFNEKERSFSVALCKTDPLNAGSDQWTKDHYLFQLLQTLLKLYSYCSVTLRQMEEIEIFASYAQSLLSYPHEWVRLSSVQFLGFVLSDINIEELSDCIKHNKSNKSRGYLYSDPRISIKTLTLDLCALLQTDGEHQELSEQVIKNLVFIARIFEKVQYNKEEEENDLPDLFWLLKRMRRISNWELIHSPKETFIRKAVFKWIAGVGTVLENKVRFILPIVLPPLIREMIGTDTVDNTLQQLSKEVANILKQRVGEDFYSTEVSKVKQKLTLKQAKRKRVSKQMAVADYELHAKKKIKKNLKKKESKKKTVAIIKRKGKKRKLSSLEDE